MSTTAARRCRPRQDVKGQSSLSIFFEKLEAVELKQNLDTGDAKKANYIYRFKTIQGLTESILIP